MQKVDTQIFVFIQDSDVRAIINKRKHEESVRANTKF